MREEVAVWLAEAAIAWLTTRSAYDVKSIRVRAFARDYIWDRDETTGEWQAMRVLEYLP